MKGRCLICGYDGFCQEHHLIRGNASRHLCDEDKLVVPLCVRCHDLVTNDPNWDRASKIYGQRLWESKYGSREEFIKRYGKSFIDAEEIRREKED